MRARRLVALGLIVIAAIGATAGYAWRGSARTDAKSASCPQAWRSGWQKLADRIGTPVYCPTWLPDPLTGQIDGPSNSIDSLDRRDGSYLIGFLDQERDEEVHVNLRGYPHRRVVPTCVDTYTVAGKTRRRPIACFSDPQVRRRVGGQDVTVYLVNRDADEWHILYAWHRDGALYAVSEHVAPPFSATQVKQNLDRMVRGLALVKPRAS